MLTPLSHQDLSIRSGAWASPTTRSLNWRASTVGILGLGNIGLQLAIMCSYLGMKVIYSNRSPREDIPKDIEYVSREEFWKRSDAIVLTCPLTEETKGLVGKEVLGKMKDGVVLVNVCKWCHSIMGAWS
jgi:phosphoglycerate dehydrogenase-like enzyme